MAVDFYYEQVTVGPGEKTNENFIVTLFIEGHPIADAKGTKKELKVKVAESALEALQQICYTVVSNDKAKVDKGSMMSRKDVKKTHEIVSGGERLGGDNVGNKMLQMMGWSEGQGLGVKDDGSIKEPIKMQGNDNTEGLGSKPINANNIQQEEAENIIKRYIASDDMQDLSFSSELGFDERSEIVKVAKKYGLYTKKVLVNEASGWKNVHLVIKKKVGPKYIIEQIEKEGSSGEHDLIRPTGGDRDTILRKYLNFQHLRKETGYPTELQKFVDAGRNNDSNESFNKFSPKKTFDYSSAPGPSGKSSFSATGSSSLSASASKSSSGPKPLMSLNITKSEVKSLMDLPNPFSNHESNYSDGGGFFKRRLYNSIGVDVDKGPIEKVNVPIEKEATQQPKKNGPPSLMSLTFNKNDMVGMSNRSINFDSYSRDKKRGFNPKYDDNSTGFFGQNKVSQQYGNNEGYADGGYSNEDYNNQEYGNDGYYNSGYRNQSYGNEGFGNESSDKLGYGKEGFGNQGYDNDSYNEGYGNDVFGNQGYGNDGYEEEEYPTDPDFDPRRLSGQFWNKMKGSAYGGMGVRRRF